MKNLSGFNALVTSGPTHEPIDAVRYIANRSSGKQGHAIAQALSDAGANVTLISGPVTIPNPTGAIIHHIETAQDLYDRTMDLMEEQAFDIAVCAAAVADWTPTAPRHNKMKREMNALTLELIETPDTLKSIGHLGRNRPRLVIGFAAETDTVLENAAIKREKKHADWLIANDVSNGQAFNREENQVVLIDKNGYEEWPKMNKTEVASRLITKIEEYFNE